MSSSDILYLTPVMHKNIFISNVSSPVTYDTTDVKINKISKSSNNGSYLLTVYIDHNDEEFFKYIDDTAILSLLSNNDKWFKNTLSEDDIKSLFNRSYCSQTNTMTLIISECTHIYIEGKQTEMKDFVKILSDISLRKQYTINITVQLAGLYIQSSQTNNKWIIKSINMFLNDEIDIDAKEEINEFWGNMMEECEKSLDNKIAMIEKKKRHLKELYNSIVKTNNSKDWENKITEFKKIIQNIIF